MTWEEYDIEKIQKNVSIPEIKSILSIFPSFLWEYLIKSLFCYLSLIFRSIYLSGSRSSTKKLERFYEGLLIYSAILPGNKIVSNNISIFSITQELDSSISSLLFWMTSLSLFPILKYSITIKSWLSFRKRKKQSRPWFIISMRNYCNWTERRNNYSTKSNSSPKVWKKQRYRYPVSLSIHPIIDLFSNFNIFETNVERVGNPFLTYVNLLPSFLSFSRREWELFVKHNKHYSLVLCNIRRNQNPKISTIITYSIITEGKGLLLLSLLPAVLLLLPRTTTVPVAIITTITTTPVPVCSILRRDYRGEGKIGRRGYPMYIEGDSNSKQTNNGIQLIFPLLFANHHFRTSLWSDRGRQSLWRGQPQSIISCICFDI